MYISKEHEVLQYWAGVAAVVRRNVDVETQTTLLCCRSNATERNRIKLGEALLRYVENNNTEWLLSV